MKIFTKEQIENSNKIKKLQSDNKDGKNSKQIIELLNSAKKLFIESKDEKLIPKK